MDHLYQAIRKEHGALAMLPCGFLLSALISRDRKTHPACDRTHHIRVVPLCVQNQIYQQNLRALNLGGILQLSNGLGRILQ